MSFFEVRFESQKSSFLISPGRHDVEFSRLKWKLVLNAPVK